MHSASSIGFLNHCWFWGHWNEDLFRCKLSVPPLVGLMLNEPRGADDDDYGDDDPQFLDDQQKPI